MFRKTIAFAVAALTLAGILIPATQADDDGAPQMTDLQSVDELKAQFNADAGTPRLILLLSPT